MFTAELPLDYRSVTAQLPLDYRSITARVPFQTVFPVIISIMDKAKRQGKPAKLCPFLLQENMATNV